METFRELREQAGYTQSALAREAGLRQASVSALETGGSEPREETLKKIAAVLKVEISVLRSAIRADAESAAGAMGDDWEFLKGLDRDLRDGLAASLVAEWTHTSTALEGNTITAGDTLFVLNEGLTVSGKSLREHQELHGHAQALRLMSAWTRKGRDLRVGELHELHRAVQTGAVVDIYAPVGKWKVEPNGTMAITTKGKSQWHDYAAPEAVPPLVADWITLLKETSRKVNSESAALEAYTEIHLGFVAIHPYADGNGRLARLLANIPVLCGGYPPILVPAAERRNYLSLLGDYSIARGKPVPGERLVLESSERDALRDFFGEQWKATLGEVEEFHARQASRVG